MWWSELWIYENNFKLTALFEVLFTFLVGCVFAFRCFDRLPQFCFDPNSPCIMQTGALFLVAGTFSYIWWAKLARPRLWRTPKTLLQVSRWIESIVKLLFMRLSLILGAMQFFLLTRTSQTLITLDFFLKFCANLVSAIGVSVGTWPGWKGGIYGWIWMRVLCFVNFADAIFCFQIKIRKLD